MKIDSREDIFKKLIFFFFWITSGNPPGASTCGAGVACRGFIHGAVRREKLQCFHLLHRCRTMRSFCGFAACPRNTHQSSLQEKAGVRVKCRRETHAAPGQQSASKSWVLCCMSGCEQSPQRGSGIHADWFYGSGLYAWQIKCCTATKRRAVNTAFDYQKYLSRHMRYLLFTSVFLWWCRSLKCHYWISLVSQRLNTRWTWAKAPIKSWKPELCFTAGG